MLSRVWLFRFLGVNWLRRQVGRNSVFSLRSKTDLSALGCFSVFYRCFSAEKHRVSRTSADWATWYRIFRGCFAPPICHDTFVGSAEFLRNSACLRDLVKILRIFTMATICRFWGKSKIFLPKPSVSACGQIGGDFSRLTSFGGKMRPSAAFETRCRGLVLAFARTRLLL